ncbi:uncharacterized protein [Typha latifolia]|uniref:uncharacterized protein n=1 Tax=Typha latifolia TaxID=4733 RepID=UPI003C300DBD
MEVVVQMAQEQDFHFGGNYNSALMIAPPSPKPFGDPSEYHRYYYSSAPTSPTRAAAAGAMRGEIFSSSNAKELDFAFNFTPSAAVAVAAADELFEGGKIKPLKPNMESQRERGRPLTSVSTTSSRSRRESRSLSPMRGEGSNKGSGSKKWKLKDLFLFRSASEGSKDTLRKYIISSSVKNSISDQDSGNRSMRRMHEMHYTANRAAAEEMKKRTPLPFHRNSLFGYLRFNPAIHSITRRLNNRGS